MLLTTTLLFIAMREIWGWSLLAAGAVAAGFMIVDGAFFLANLVKWRKGGYVPLLLASGTYGLMWIWASWRGGGDRQHARGGDSGGCLLR